VGISDNKIAAPNDWTIEDELKKLSGKATISEAVCSLGLVPGPRKFSEIVPRAEKWVRGGSETYVYPFSVRTEDFELSLMLKAIVAFSFGGSLEMLLAEWISRRNLLTDEGVVTPKLYYHGNGVILEDFVPNELADVVANEGGKSPVVRSFFKYAGILSRLGFVPIDGFSDLRTMGGDVIPVDFGEDLGPARVASSGSTDLFKPALEWVRVHGARLEREDITEVETVYHFNRIEDYRKGIGNV
jgi:hypothetical protein